MSALWVRLSGGYLRADGEWFLLRGARMTHGANAWLGHRRLPADSPRIGRAEGSLAFDFDGGGPLWTIDATGYAETAPADTDAPLYVHEFDAGWLSEAKVVVEQIETREARA